MPLVNFLKRLVARVRQAYVTITSVLYEAAGTLGVTLGWLGLNVGALVAINAFAAPRHDSIFDLHVQLHLGVIAVMIWIETRMGYFILKRFISIGFCRWLLGSRRVEMCLGPVATALVLLTECCAIAFGTCAFDERCSQGLISSWYGIRTYPLKEVYVVGAITLLAFAMRAYAWVQHFPRVATANASH